MLSTVATAAPGLPADPAQPPASTFTTHKPMTEEEKASAAYMVLRARHYGMTDVDMDNILTVLETLDRVARAKRFRELLATETRPNARAAFELGIAQAERTTAGV